MFERTNTLLQKLQSLAVLTQFWLSSFGEKKKSPLQRGAILNPDSIDTKYKSLKGLKREYGLSLLD